MNRRFLTGAVILACSCLFANVTYACIDIYIGIMGYYKKYVEVSSPANPIKVELYADVWEGEADAETWYWSWDSGLDGDPKAMEVDYSTADFWSDTAGIYQVDVEVESADGWSEDDDWAKVYVVEVAEVIGSKYVLAVGEQWQYAANTNPLNCHGNVDFTWDTDGGDYSLSSGTSLCTVSWDTAGEKTLTVYCGASQASKEIFVIGVEIDEPSSFPAYVAVGDSLSISSQVYPPGLTGGTYSWTKVDGPGTVTFSPSASDPDPEFSADEAGEYTVKVEYSNGGATASDTSGTIAVMEAVSVEWRTFLDNVDVVNGRIYPGKKTSGDSHLDRRRTVSVVATIDPPMADRYVYFKSFDVDDPSDLDPDGNGPDNRSGTAGAISSAYAITDGSGEATVELTVSLHPGDNYRIAASCTETSLDPPYMTQTMADSGNPPAGVVLSPILTTWRKLWIERDSMNTVDSQGGEQNFVSGTGATYTLIQQLPDVTRVDLGMQLPSDFAEDDHFNGSLFQPTGWPTYVVVNDTHNNFFSNDTVDVYGDLRTASASFSLWDDDYATNPMRPHITLPYTNLTVDTSAFQEAFIEPCYLGSNYSTVIPFERNIEIGDVDWNTIFHDDNQPSSGYWSACSLAAFQCPSGHDNDPEGGTVWLGEAHTGDNCAVVYLEMVREYFSTNVKIMTHEIGHTSGLDDCTNTDCVMKQGSFPDTFCDNCLDYMRSRANNW